MRGAHRFLAWLATLAVLFALPAGAQDLPARPEGPVYDGAQILDPAAEAALDTKLRAWTQRSGRPIVVATVPTLGSATVETLAADLYEAWGIGPADTDQGVLLVVAPQERAVRIEVGYGLTPIITDILSGRIIRGDITPRFKQGDYAGGINSGVDALIAQLAREPADARAIAQAAENAEAQERQSGGRRGGGGSAVSTIVWLGIMLGLIFLFSRGGGGGGGGGGRRHRRRGGIARDVLLWSAIGAMNGRRGGGGFGGGFGGGGFGGGGSGGGGFGGFGGGMSGGGGASGSW